MSGVKGRSGTNLYKPWQDALRMVVFEKGKDGFMRLRKIAESCVAAAESGDMAAIQEIANRLDGRPVQESTITVVKRDGEDWTRDELVGLLERSESENGSAGITAPDGRGGGPDRVH